MSTEEKMQFAAGEKIFAYLSIDGCDPIIEELTITGFTCYGIHFKERSWLHFSAYSFYGSGYHNNGFAIYVKDKDIIPAALAAEKKRLEPAIDFVI